MWNNINPYGTNPFTSRGPYDDPEAAEVPPQNAARRTRGAPVQPHPDDQTLIDRFRTSATDSGLARSTVRIYSLVLCRFSAFLWLHGVPSISVALGRPPEDKSLEDYVESFISRYRGQGWNTSKLSSALKHLRELVASGKDSITIRGRKKSCQNISEADEELIKKALADISLRPIARGFARYVQGKRGHGLDNAYLVSPEAGEDIAQVASGSKTNISRGKRMLAYLRARAEGATPHVKKYQDTSMMPPDDRELLGKYKKNECGQQISGRSLDDLRSFSAWRAANNLPSLAKSRHDLAALLADKEVYVNERYEKSPSVPRVKDRTVSQLISSLETSLKTLCNPDPPFRSEEGRSPTDSDSLFRGLPSPNSGERFFSYFGGLSAAPAPEEVNWPGTEGGRSPTDSDSLFRGLPSPNSGERFFSYFGGLSAAPAPEEVNWPGTEGARSPTDSDSLFRDLPPPNSGERFLSYFGGLSVVPEPEPGEVNWPGTEGGRLPTDSDYVYGELSPLNSGEHFSSDFGGLSAAPAPGEVNWPGTEGGRLPTDSEYVYGGLSPLNFGERDGLSAAPASGEVSWPGTEGPSFVKVQYAVLPYRPEARGFASGEGLNCLLDSICQRFYNIRRYPNIPLEGLDAEVQRWRGALSGSGLVPAQGEIDIYSGVGAHLTESLRVKLQVIQKESLDFDGEEYVRHIPHPVLGNEGPLFRLLHTPGHFQPLWD